MVARWPDDRHNIARAATAINDYMKDPSKGYTNLQFAFESFATKVAMTGFVRWIIFL
jgi:hypothetical protein